MSDRFVTGRTSGVQAVALPKASFSSQLWRPTSGDGEEDVLDDLSRAHLGTRLTMAALILAHLFLTSSSPSHHVALTPVR
jgi:hypothetical protein